MAKLLVLCMAVLTCGAGCTTRGAYEAVRTNERNHCNDLPDTERERCLARTADDFKTFQRKRAEAQGPG